MDMAEPTGPADAAERGDLSDVPIPFRQRIVLPGEVRQLGYVVRDIEEAMRHWVTALGVGPFFYLEDARIDDFLFRGEQCHAALSIAFANVGALQVELIEQRNDAPSSYKEFLDAGREGLQHVAFWTRAMDAQLSQALASGLSIMQSGLSGGDPEGRHVYFETEQHPGTVLELSEVKGVKGEFFTYVAESAADWDGTDPIRRIG